MAITRSKTQASTSLGEKRAKVALAPRARVATSSKTKEGEPKPPPTDLPIYQFASASKMEEFFDREHETCAGFYLKLAKKNSGVPSVTSADAVTVALCFGWINGRAEGLDDNFYLARYTPRRAKSMWSQINVNTVVKLSEEGRMRPAGIAAVDAAKADGRWARAYSSPTTIAVPDDFEEALRAEPAANAFFQTLNKSRRYSVLWRIETASPNARPGRISALVQTLAAGQVPGEKPVATDSKQRAGRGSGTKPKG